MNWEGMSERQRVKIQNLMKEKNITIIDYKIDNEYQFDLKFQSIHKVTENDIDILIRLNGGSKNKDWRM